MPYKPEAKNAMLDHLAGLVTHVSLHSAFPATAANEVASARQPIAFSASAGGILDDSSNGVAIAVPAGATVAAVGYWGAATAGTLYADDDVATETFTNAGTYNLTDAKLDLNA